MIIFGVGLFGALSGFMASLFCSPARTNDETDKWRRQHNAQQEQLLQELKRPARRGEGTETEVACDVWNGRVTWEDPARRLSVGGDGAFSLLVL